MKQFDIIKKLFLFSLLCGAGVLNAQVHPLAFGSYTLGTTATPDNWYANYVGLRFEVVSPASVAGDKEYKNTNDGTTSTANWGGAIPPTILNCPLMMPQAGDSLCGSAISVNMTGKVALVYRGGGIEFGFKALQAQNAGARACVIINNIPGGPVGMAAGSSGGSVTIPVFMISKADGDALDVLYNSGTIPNVTITNWGQSFLNDLGFVPGGLAAGHNFATPKSQLTANIPEYMGMDGAFIANYGQHPATGVKVSATLSWTPTGGSSPSVVHTNNSGTLATFTVADSIYAMFAPSDYNIAAPATTGKYDLHYQILSDSSLVEQFPADDSATVSFYVTDSVFSKSRYDFTANEPLRTIYYAFNNNDEYIWGNMYYVANAGSSLSTVQYAMAASGSVAGYPSLGTSNNVYLFKWVDGYNDVADGFVFPLDSIIQNGELQLVSLGVKNFDVGDTSGVVLSCRTMADSNGVGSRPNLDAHSWYYLAIDAPSTSGYPIYVGADGILNPYPRIYGRYMYNGFFENSNMVQSGPQSDIWGMNSGYGNSPCPETWTAYVQSVDSFNYGQMKGLIPSVAIITGAPVSSVSNVSAPFADVKLYPNPTSDILNVSVNLNEPAKKVVYELIDGLARFVSKETHYNVNSEIETISTSKLSSGTYYLIITVDDTKIMSRKFTVIK